MRPLNPTSVSAFLSLAQHSANATDSRGNCGLLRSTIRQVLAQVAKPVRGTLLHTFEQRASGPFLNAPQRLRQIEVSTSHQAESQTGRGFSCDRLKVSHCAFFLERAPQTKQAVWARNLVKISFPANKFMI